MSEFPQETPGNDIEFENFKTAYLIDHPGASDEEIQAAWDELKRKEAAAVTAAAPVFDPIKQSQYDEWRKTHFSDVGFEEHWNQVLTNLVTPIAQTCTLTPGYPPETAAQLGFVVNYDPVAIWKTDEQDAQNYLANPLRVVDDKFPFWVSCAPTAWNEYYVGDPNQVLMTPGEQFIDEKARGEQFVVQLFQGNQFRGIEGADPELIMQDYAMMMYSLGFTPFDIALTDPNTLWNTMSGPSVVAPNLKEYQKAVKEWNEAVIFTSDDWQRAVGIDLSMFGENFDDSYMISTMFDYIYGPGPYHTRITSDAGFWQTVKIVTEMTAMEMGEALNYQANPAASRKDLGLPPRWVENAKGELGIFSSVEEKNEQLARWQEYNERLRSEQNAENTGNNLGALDQLGSELAARTEWKQGILDTIESDADKALFESIINQADSAYSTISENITPEQWIRDQIRNQSKEFGVVLDANGNVIDFKVGTERSVTWTNPEMKYFDSIGATIIHNHVGGGTFSLPDLYALSRYPNVTYGVAGSVIIDETSIPVDYTIQSKRLTSLDISKESGRYSGEFINKQQEFLNENQAQLEQMGYTEGQINNFAFEYAAKETDAVDYTSTMPVVPGTPPTTSLPDNLPPEWEIISPMPNGGWLVRLPDGSSRWWFGESYEPGD